MANLYLTEQGSILRKTGDRLLVEKDGETLLDVQCHKLETILIFGNVQFTTQAVHELFEHGIELALLTIKGKLIGQLTPIMPKNIKLRMAQYQRYHDQTFCLQFSQAIVKGKLQNSLETLKTFSYSHKNINVSQEINAISQTLESAGAAQSLDELRGFEGTGARTYFNAFGKMILTDNLKFDGRQKHPATDPINALLSFGYTLLFNEINSHLDGVGFDPYIGFYHQIEYGRPSLACDMVEEFRSPIVDRLTLNLINNRVLTEDDFYLHEASGSMYLKHESLKKYLEKYERFILQEFAHSDFNNGRGNVRKAIRNQAQKIAASVTDNNPYQAMIFTK